MNLAERQSGKSPCEGHSATRYGNGLPQPPWARKLPLLAELVRLTLGTIADRRSNGFRVHVNSRILRRPFLGPKWTRSDHLGTLATLTAAAHPRRARRGRAS